MPCHASEVARSCLQVQDTQATITDYAAFRLGWILFNFSRLSWKWSAYNMMRSTGKVVSVHQL
eukprot:2171737-Pyramimonas_sp.AAC.1